MTQNTQEICDNMKSPKLRKIGIQESKESQLQGPENIPNKIMEENFPNLKKRDAYKYTRSFQKPAPEKKIPCNIIIKT